MEFYLLIPVIEVAFCVGLLVVLMTSGKRHIARRPFAMFLVLMAFWGVFVFMMRFSRTMEDALLWEKFILGAILTASLLFFQFSISLTSSRVSVKIMVPLYTAFFLVMALIPTNFVVRGMQAMWYGKAPVVGPAFPLFVLCAYVPLVFSSVMLIKLCRSRNVDERNRAQYILVGMIAMFIGATTDYLPSLGLNLYPLGIIGNILFCVIATSGMLKHNLLEMRVMARKGLSYALTGIVVFGTFGCLIYLLSYFFHNFMSPVSMTITIVATFIVATVFHPVLAQFQQTVDRWFFRGRYDHIQILKRFTEKTKDDLNLEGLSGALVNAAAAAMDSRGAYLLLPETPTGEYTTFIYAGQQPVNGLTFAVNSALVTTMQQQGIIDSTDMETIPSLLALTAYEQNIIRLNSIELMVPLRNEGELIGILFLTDKHSGELYTHEERRLLMKAASDVAANMRNATRFESLKQGHNKMEKVIDGIIHAITLVVETRDPYTAGHQRRVAELARRIAGEMGLSPWQQSGIYISGLLHDVGKIAVPSEILSKPGKISQYEFSIIKNHSQVGYDILQRIDFSWPVAKAVLQHHERMDGSGYPEGLSGEEIILEARILGVADVVEAMSSHRPYRPALGLTAALEEIIKGMGKLYDPTVARACLSLLEKNEMEFDRIMEAAASNEYTLELV